MLEWMLIGVGFTGALTLVFAARGLGRRLGLVASFGTYFSPKGGCTDAIVKMVESSRREILMQAYSFSCPTIAAALVKARARGVKVQILLDRANEKETYSELGALEQQGLEVLIDAHHAIAHNKIIVIDRHTVITGSFNFTRQAELENAENLLIIQGHPDIVKAYLQNFEKHREHAQAPGTALAHPVRVHTPATHPSLAEVKTQAA